MMATYLVTGATGPTGRSTIEELRKSGAKVRAFVHAEDARADALRKLGAEIVVGDLRDLDAVRAATKGITAAYFVYPIRDGFIDASVYFAQAAIEAGVKTIVNMSQISARPDSESKAARDHWVCERLLDRSGLAVIHLRPTFFSEWLLYHGRAKRIAQTGVIMLPFGAGRHAPIAAEDQGRVIAAILLNPEPHAGQVYPLFGPVEMDHHQIATQVGETIGRDVRYDPIEISAFRAHAEKDPAMPAHLTQHLCAVAQDYQNGIFAGTNDVVERITGRRAMTVSEFVTQHRGAFVA